MKFSPVSLFTGVQLFLFDFRTGKNKSPFSFVSVSSLAGLLAAMMLVLALCGTAQAQLYWDTNNNTAGFGTAGGTWAAPTTNNATQGVSMFLKKQ